MRAPTRPAPNETEEQRLARLDRDAVRQYSTKRYAGGGVTKRYRRDQQDAPDALQIEKPKNPE